MLPLSFHSDLSVVYLPSFRNRSLFLNRFFLIAALLMLFTFQIVNGQSTATGDSLTVPKPAKELAQVSLDKHLDICFAKIGETELLVDIFLSREVDNPPLVMYIHGGGWNKGDRKNCKLAWLVKQGYAVASIEYRMSHEAIFPAQIHDCKGALRWLRAHETEYGYDATKVVVAGASAGGHLAALMGTSGGSEFLEGNTAGYVEQSSEVQGVIDYYGPTDFMLRAKRQPSKTSRPSGSVYRLLGGPVNEKLELARHASPVVHITSDDPPMLILHGDKDPIVHVSQSEHFHKQCINKGVDSTLYIAKGSGHGWRDRSIEERELVIDFLASNLKSK